MHFTKRLVFRLFAISASFIVSSVISSAIWSAIWPIAKNEMGNELKDRSTRQLNIAGDASANGIYIDDLHSPMPSANYDALHALQSGIRSPNEIQADVAKIAGQGPMIQWNSEIWQKNKIKAPLKLVSVLSQIQNLETQFEIMHLLTLPGEKRNETSITLFTDRVNAAENTTLRSSILVAKSIRFEKDLPVYDRSSLTRYDFHLRTNAPEQNFNLQEPEGTYDLKPVSLDEEVVDPFAELNQVNGSFNEVADYEYDQQIGGKHQTVSIVPRWNAATQTAGLGVNIKTLIAKPTLTIEVQIHEAESLNVRSFVLVYE